MKNKFTKIIVCFFALVSLIGDIHAQAPFKYLTYIFPSDSLKGFDEESAKQQALAGGFFGPEYHVIMYNMKRNFINNKYRINQPVASNARVVPTNSVMNAPCTNEDFEASPSTVGTTTASGIGPSLAGWQISWGQNTGLNGSCTMAGCCPTPQSYDMWIRTTPWVAPAPLGTIPNSPFGGSKVIQMNDNIVNQGEVGRIQQTFPVTPTNCLFQFAYMAAMDGTGHLCCDQPFMRVDLLDCFNNTLACPQVSITPPGPSCATVTATGWTTSTAGISYTPSWVIKAIDLRPYLGQCVTIKITVGDCDGWAHYGYAFIDCQCLPMTVSVNNIPFLAGNTTAAVAACGVSTATMVAPPGLGPYSWTGPPGSGITANTNTTITTTTPGNYTLTMNPVGVCAPITLTVNLQFGTNPTAGFSITNSCTTYTITNTGTAAPAVQSYSFTGPGAPSSFTTTSPTSVVSFPPSSTYTICQTVTNASNCFTTFSMVINTPPGPSPAFSASPSFTQCFTGNAFTFNATTTAGTHTYNFSPSSTAPPPGFTNPYGPVSFTAPGTYTVTHTVNSAGCISTTQSVVVVNSVPTATASAVAPPCAGSAATLTGVGGPGTMSWAGPAGYTGVGPNALVNNFQTVNNGIYTLTINNFGCITTRTVSVTLGAVPTLTVSNTGPYCVGQTITLNATMSSTATSYSYWSGPGGFFWNPAPSMTVANTATTTSSGVWYFYVSWPGGCYAQAQTTVQVVASPTVSASNTGPYCPGATIQLNSPTAAGSYTWSGPGSFTANVQNPTRPVATATMAGTYTVLIGTGSCTAAATTTVVISPLPTPTIGSNSPVCTGGSLNLTSGGGTTYAWSGPNSFTSAVQNPVIASTTTLNAGVYTVTVTSAAGCKNTATVNVTITTPTASASNTGPYCVGATIQLNTPAATSYTWSGPSAFSSNLQNPTIAAATTAMSGVYTVTATTGACMATATTSVTVNALPTPTAANTGPYCPGSTIQLNGSSASTYTWSGPSAFSSNSQNPTIAAATTAMSGIYTFSVTDVNGCKNSVTTSVTVNANPVPTIGSNSPVCLGNNINLTSGGGTAYAWSGPAGFTSAVQNPTITGATLTNAGIYTVTVTSLGCTGTNTVNVVVTTPTTSASNTGPFCAGTTIQLNTPAATSYTWSGPAAFSSNAQNPTRPAATTAMSGNYTVIVSIGTCTASATTSVTVNALPTPTAGNTGPYCPGNTIQLNGSSASTYTWSGPAAFSSNSQNPAIAAATTAMSGIYTFSVTDVNGCKSSVTTNVVVNPNPTPVINSNSPVCLGTNINLTSGGGTGYAWSGPAAFTSALQNPTIAGASVANAGVYTVTVTALGCTATNTVNVTVMTPTASASNTGPYCANSTIQLNTPAATSYTWSGPAAFSSNVQNPTRPAATTAMSGNYTVIVSIGTCTASATTSVTVNALPTPTVSSNSPVCVGQPINFSGSAASSYTWSGPAAFTSNLQNPSIATAGTANAGVYTYSVTDVNGCKNSITTNVVVNTLPVITVNNPTACVNQNISLTATGGASYAWSGPNSYNSASQNPVISNAASNMTGAYTVTVTSAAGCKNTAVANVSVVALPVVNVATGGPVCVGATLLFTSNGGTSYSWSGPSGFSSNQQNPSLANSTMGMNGLYTVLVTANTCTASAAIGGTVNALPTPLINSNSPVCVGQPINFTANGGTIYTWSGPGGFTSNGSTPSIPLAGMSNNGTYSLTVSDANGCVGSTSALVIVNPLPTPVATGTSACQGANAIIGASGGTGYSWSGPGGFSSSAQNPVISAVTPANAGQYTVVVTSAAGCSNTAVANMVVNPAPTPSIIMNSPICVNDILSMSGTGGVSYSWSGPNGFLSASQNPTVLANSTAFSGNYNLTVIDINGCSGSTMTTATINASPNVFITASNNKGCAPLCVTFTASSSSAIQAYSWNMGDGSTMTGPNAMSCYNATGIYTANVSVQDMNGCFNATTHTVQIYQQPVADFNYSPIKPIENVDVVQFTDASYTGTITSWSWYFMSNAQYTSSQQNPTFIYTDAGQYAIALVVKNDQGCSDTVVKSIVVGEDFGIWVPNAFTPNGDGLNDVFYAKGYGVTKFSLEIYDRWGEKVFTSSDMNSAWDGTYMSKGGSAIQEGVYTWMIKVTSVAGKAKELTGHVTLIK